MFKKVSFLLLLATCLQVSASAQPSTGNPAQLPFNLSLEEVTQTELPGLHSFAFGRWDGWWVAIGGRINGLHGFFPFTAFPENGANTNIWLIDPETGESHTFDVNNLGNGIAVDPLKSTNPQHAQVGDTLYITGGYGKQASDGNFVTFPYLTTVHLPTLVQHLLANTNPAPAFRQLQNNGMAVCGGEMDYMDGYFYLVGGHHFTGNYSQTPSPLFTQVYTHAIRKFKVQQANNGIALSDYTETIDEVNLHRRDFNLVPIVRPGGTEALVLHGGVFRPDADLPYYNPVLIRPDTALEVDTDYEQVFSQYTCPVATLYDANSQHSYSVFFGGLSAYYFNNNTQTITYDERVPFIRDISTFERRPDGTAQEYLMPVQFDALLGSNMIFSPVETAPQYDNEVFKLDQINGKTLIGYLFGGIKADIPNITTSSASNRMFKVYIEPKPVSVKEAALVSAPVWVYPNCAPAGTPISVESLAPVQQLALYRMDGTLIGHYGPTQHEAARMAVGQQPAGIYVLCVDGMALKLVRY